MSSVDYKAFVQSEVEECARKSDIYVGAQDDLGAPAEHFSIEHLDALLSRSIPRELRAMYLAEYADIRAGIRALAVIGLTRSDFFDHAAQMSISDREFLRESMARNSYISALAKRGFSVNSLSEFLELETEYESRKSEVEDRTKSENGVPSNLSLSDKDIVRAAMKDTQSSNSRGVSSGRKQV